MEMQEFWLTAFVIGCLISWYASYKWGHSDGVKTANTERQWKDDN